MSDKVDRADIRKKLKQIKAEVDDSATAAKPAGVTAGAGVFTAALGLAFLLGERKARKRTTVVEVRRS